MLTIQCNKKNMGSIPPAVCVCVCVFFFFFSYEE